MWGVFDENREEIHIAPCDENGELRYPHIIDSLCVCDPKIVADNNGCIVLHNEEN